jgi:hypothetical protein
MHARHGSRSHFAPVDRRRFGGMEPTVKEYRAQIAAAIRELHGCESIHESSVPVTEVFQGKIAWDGLVEVLALIGHPKAKKAYAWGFQESGRWEITTVLEISPVISPQTAVKAAIVSAAKKLNVPRNRNNIL